MYNRNDALVNNIAIQAINNNKIYIYTVSDINGQKVNDGWLKVGQTIRTTDTRVREQSHTAGLTAEILYEVSAQDINGNNFTDSNIHEALTKKGFTRNEGTEWFSVGYLKQSDLLNAIKEVIENRISCIGDFAQLKDRPTQFKLRPNQQQAVDETYERWQIAKDNGSNLSTINQFLWNAKPRFGKTLTAYEFAKKIQARKVLIVTQRTAISDSWHKDYYDWIKDSTDYKFGSSKQNQLKNDNDNIIHTALGKSDSAQLASNLDEHLIFYISFADIKGKSEHEFKASNQWVFDTSWDLFIIDETHEGSETDKAIDVFEHLNTGFTLHLSGTPFKKIVSKDFNAKNTYTWSYADEQERKNNWDYANGENPYAEMPKLNIFTYQLSPELRNVCKSEDFSFDFNEFFKNNGERFTHEAEINQFLDNLSAEQNTDVADATAQYYPFADSKTRDELRHTFWLLPQYGGVKMTELLKKLLKQHSYFKDHEIIMAAGDGDDDRPKSDKALQEVHRKIGDKPWQTKTITLSCGQLTTGVTVAPWTAVLMLNNLSSPSLYLQAAFRSQNPWRYEIDGTTYNKTDCYVFDFAPDRILKIVDDYANLDVTRSTNATRKQNIRKLINYLPVISLDRSGSMKYLEASEILEMPHYYDARDIVDNGFMSNKLFNIGNIFNLPKDKREQATAIINLLDPVQNKKVKKNQPEVNPEAVNLPENITISTSPLGERQYEIQTTDETGEPTVEIITESQVSEALDDYGDDEPTSKSVTELRTALEEIEKQKPKVKTEEEKQRDRLRGFSRTIPMFLMAYGKPTTTLANFDEFVNAQVFLELAGITREQFRILRDDCQFFNEPNFNAAIKEFLDRKDELKSYYRDDETSDIFEFIPPQDTNQIFTPKRVVNLQLDALESADPLIFKNPHSTFLDPQMKSGQYITEIVKRLYRYSKDKDIERIITTQVYGLAPTKILTDITHEYIFGFADLRDKKKYQRNFVERNLLADDVHGNMIIKQPNGLANVTEEVWGEMKFTAVVGNPPYQETSGKSDTQTQGNSSWIYQHFQAGADRIGRLTSLIYPFGGWFDSPSSLGGLGQTILSDGHTVSVNAYEGTSDKRAWYRTDKSPEPIFGTGANLSAGVSIVLRDNAIIHDSFVYSNRIYSDAMAEVKISDWQSLTPNPDFAIISSKLTGDKLASIVKKNLFGIESNFVELNPNKVSQSKSDWQNPVLLLANDKSGSSGRTKQFWTDKNMIPRGEKYIGLYKVIMTSAYPKQKLTLGNPIIENVLRRAEELIEILPQNSACGASRLCLYMSEDKQDCERFLKYTQTHFFAGLVIQEPNRRATIGAVIPLQDFTSNSDIDWSQSIPEIDQQLYRKYNLDEKEIDFIETRVKAME